MNGIVMENLENFALRFTQGAAHFLWIGVLLAAAVWVADRLLVRSAAARHGLHLVGMLLLTLALPVCLVVVNVTSGPERKYERAADWQLCSMFHLSKRPNMSCP